MIPRKLPEVSANDLASLVRERVQEGRTLDYKRDLNLSNDDDKKELARDVSSLANAAGGDLVYGVEEARDGEGRNLGYPARLVGVPCPNPDATRQRIENIIRDTVDPRLHALEIAFVGAFELGPVVIVRVPRSWAAPHMVQHRSQTHFYSRNSAGRQPLDVREIRAAFLAGADEASAVERFRGERVGRILADQTPVALFPDRLLRLAVHVVPLALLRTGETVSLLDDELARLLPPLDGHGWNNRFNLDGLVSHTSSTGDPNWSYSVLFRNGAIEGVATLPIDYTETPPKARGLAIERTVIEGLGQYSAVVEHLQMPPPFSVHVSLTGTTGVQLVTREHIRPWQKDFTIDRDVLILPDILVDSLSVDLGTSMKPLFDALWQASGFKQSPSYESGVWNSAGR